MRKPTVKAPPPIEVFELLSVRLNLDKARALCAVPGRPTAPMSIAAVRHWIQFIDIDTERAMSDATDTNVPVIVAIVAQQYIPIVGYHRLYKADRQDAETIEAFILSPEETEECAMMSKRSWYRILRNLSMAQ